MTSPEVEKDLLIGCDVIFNVELLLMRLENDLLVVGVTEVDALGALLRRKFAQLRPCVNGNLFISLSKLLY